MYLMDYSDNYYVRTKSFNLNTNKLSESLQCDVCIIGAGLSGISSALYLSKINPSLNIVILEKNKVGWGASGRNGGQLLHSFSGENYSGQKHTQEEIKTLWQFTLEAVREVKKNIKDLNIQCDLIEGYIQAAVNKSHDEELKKYVDQLQTEYNYESATYLSKSQMEQYFESPYYKSAMYDSECGQIHPLNYCLGLAKELLKNKNCKIFEDTGVISYNSQNKVTINTEKNVPFHVIAIALENFFAPTFAPTIAISAPPIPKIIGINNNSSLMAIPKPAVQFVPKILITVVQKRAKAIVIKD